jgi:hypothetical protein
LSSPVVAAARPTGARSSFVAPFTEESNDFFDTEWVPPAAWVMPAGAREPLHFKDLFKAVVAGPAAWTAKQRREWGAVFGHHQRDVLPSQWPMYGVRRRTVEAARRAFMDVASLRREYFGKSGVTYNLASAVRG